MYKGSLPQRAAGLNNGWERIEYQYDAAGNMTALTAGNGNVREYVYSPNGNILAVKEPDGGESIYGYDCMGDLVSIRQEEVSGRAYWEEAAHMNQKQKRVTRFERDAAGKLTAMTDTFGNMETYSYDAFGNRTGMVACGSPTPITR